MCPCPECFPNGLPCHGTCRPDTVSCPLYRLILLFLDACIVVYLCCCWLLLLLSMFPKWSALPRDLSSWYSLLSALQVTIVIVGCIHCCWSLLLLLMISQMFPKPPYSSRNLSSWYSLLSHLQVIIVGIAECMPSLLIIIVVVDVNMLLTCCCQWFLKCFPNGLHCYGTCRPDTVSCLPCRLSLLLLNVCHRCWSLLLWLLLSMISQIFPNPFSVTGPLMRLLGVVILCPRNEKIVKQIVE